MVNTWPQVDNAIQWLDLYPAQSFLLTLIHQIVIYWLVSVIRFLYTRILQQLCLTL